MEEDKELVEEIAELCRMIIESVTPPPNRLLFERVISKKAEICSKYGLCGEELENRLKKDCPGYAVRK